MGDSRREYTCFLVKWGISEEKTLDFQLNGGFSKRKRDFRVKRWICKVKTHDFRVKWGNLEEKTRDFRVNWEIFEEKTRVFHINGGFAKRKCVIFA